MFITNYFNTVTFPTRSKPLRKGNISKQVVTLYICTGVRGLLEHTQEM